MTLQQQIWQSKDADLFRDLATYRQAVADNQFPEMIPHWQETIQMIEREIEQRNLLAAVVVSRVPMPMSEVPF